MKRFLCLLFCLVTLPALAKNTILILGDSISAGYGIEINQGWVTLLQQRLREHKYPYEVVNASISGDTTANGLARLPEALNTYHPKVTIIELGGNDGLRGIPPAVIQRNLVQLIALAQQAHSQVLVVGVRLPPNYGPEYTQQFQKIFHTIQTQRKVIVVPLFLKAIDDNPKLMQPDGVHPTAVAQPQLLNNVWVVLKKML
jgi:acyl-CoA thioesterase I